MNMHIPYLSAAPPSRMREMITWPPRGVSMPPRMATLIGPSYKHHITQHCGDTQFSLVHGWFYLWYSVEGYTSSLEYFFTKLWKALKNGAETTSANSHIHTLSETAAAQGCEQDWCKNWHTHKHTHIHVAGVYSVSQCVNTCTGVRLLMFIDNLNPARESSL